MAAIAHGSQSATRRGRGGGITPELREVLSATRIGGANSIWDFLPALRLGSGALAEQREVARDLAGEAHGVRHLAHQPLRPAVEAPVALADLLLDLLRAHVLVALERLEARHAGVVELAAAVEDLVQRRAGVGRHGAELHLVGVEALDELEGLLDHRRRLLGEADHAEGARLDAEVARGVEDLDAAGEVEALLAVEQLGAAVLAQDLDVARLDAHGEVLAAGLGHRLQELAVERLDRGLALPDELELLAPDALAELVDAVLARGEDRVAEDDVRELVHALQVDQLGQ